jgi:YihY family inner membrane protein
MRLMDKLAPIRSFDRLQQRRKLLAVPLAVQKKVSDDGAGNYAALIAYYGFVSLFPLLLLAVSVLGFIVHSDAGARSTILSSGLPDIPIIGTTLKDGHLTGSGIGIVIGAVGALWAGLGITNTLQNTFNQIYGVPYERRPNFLKLRLRGLRLLLAVGVFELVTISLTGLISAGVGGAVLDVAGFVVTIALNAALIAVAFRFLADSSVPKRELLPGIVFATIGWELLQAVGGIYVHHVLAKASSTYGSFAEVIGLLAWLYLAARIIVYAAELNSVLAHHYWPRSLLEPTTKADDEVRASLAKAQERVPREHVEVSFETPTEATPSQGDKR